MGLLKKVRIGFITVYLDAFKKRPIHSRGSGKKVFM